jgi:RNA polymerase sigma-70 factor
VSPDPIPAHKADLALARACASGDMEAWERFVREYRPILRRAADAMAPGGAARDVADELFGDLYGLREHQGERQPLLQYFHGRSSLATWLRAVLAQRYVDKVRASRRTQPLPDDESAPLRAVRPQVPGAETSSEESRCRVAVNDSLRAALAELEPRDRLRLRCYYTQGLKLAAIGKMFGEHEATASRQLAKLRRDLGQTVQQRMRETHGYDQAGLDDCLKLVMSDSGDLDLTSLLARTSGEIVQNMRNHP